MKRGWWIAALGTIVVLGVALVVVFGVGGNTPTDPASAWRQGRAPSADAPGTPGRDERTAEGIGPGDTRTGNPAIAAALAAGGTVPVGSGVGGTGGQGGLRANSPPDAGTHVPGWPTRDMIDAAFSGVDRQVAACAREGEARVRVTVRGETGRVMAVDVLGDHADTPVGQCVRDAAMSTLFAPFTTPTFSVVHTFRLGPEREP